MGMITPMAIFAVVESPLSELVVLPFELPKARDCVGGVDDGDVGRMKITCRAYPCQLAVSLILNVAGLAVQSPW